jgi:hypothetical protein
LWVCYFVAFSRREDGSVIYCCCWSSPAQSLSGLSPVDSKPYFIVPIFETPPTWKARTPYLYPPRKGWPSYTPGQWVSELNEVEVNLRQTVNRSWCLAPIWSPWPDFCFLSDDCGFLHIGHPLRREDGSVIYLYNCFYTLPEQPLLDRSPQNSRQYFLYWSSL